MAHQPHAIPWNTLASHFRYQRPPHREGPADIMPLNLPNQAKDIGHFVRVLANRIAEFGATERAKYAPVEEYEKRAKTWVKTGSLLEDGATISGDGKRGIDKKGDKTPKTGLGKAESRKVLSDNVLENYRGSVWLGGWSRLSEREQNVEYWVLEPPRAYSADHGTLSDATKILIMEASQALPAASATAPTRNEGSQQAREAMETLLLLASHPQIPLRSLIVVGWGHNFGLGSVSECALRSYVYLNLLCAMQEAGSDICEPIDNDGPLPTKDDDQGAGLKRKKYMDTPGYKSLLFAVADQSDHDSQNLVHRAFLWPRPGGAESEERDPMADVGELREYLKGVWRVMVVYDVTVREAGGDPEWEQDITRAIRLSVRSWLNRDYNEWRFA